MEPNAFEANDLIAAEVARRVSETLTGLLGDPANWKFHGAKPLPEQRRIEDLILEYSLKLEADGTGRKHADAIAAKLRRLGELAGWKTPADISAANVQKALSDLRQHGKSRGNKGKPGLGPQTSNHYLTAAKQFARWLKKPPLMQIETNPLEDLRPLNVECDLRHERRALTADEFNRLIEAAANGKDVETISGRDRAMLYCVAAWTGFRKRALGSLTIESFDFAGEPPRVTVQAKFDKSKKRRVTPLHAELVTRLQAWFKSKRPQPGEILWPVSKDSCGTDRDTAAMMRRDLFNAAVPYIDALNRYADMHANRHTFVTALARSGVAPADTQRLAGHKDINITLGVYTDVLLADSTAAIAKLPPPPEICFLASTGTEPINGGQTSALSHGLKIHRED